MNTEDDKEDTEEERSSQEPQTPQERSISQPRSGVHEHMRPEEAKPSQLEIDEPSLQLIQSSRVKKLNPKYIEADLAQVSVASKPTLNQEKGQSRERLEDTILRKPMLRGRNVSNTGPTLNFLVPLTLAFSRSIMMSLGSLLLYFPLPTSRSLMKTTWMNGCSEATWTIPQPQASLPTD